MDTCQSESQGIPFLLGLLQITVKEDSLTQDQKNKNYPGFNELI